MTLNTTYDDAWGAGRAEAEGPQSDEVVRVPHLELRALPEPAPSTSRSYDTASTRLATVRATEARAAREGAREAPRAGVPIRGGSVTSEGA